jgi:integrase
MPILTAPSVQKYAAQAKRREIPDAKATGLYLVIQPKPSGAKSWALRFRRPSGLPAKMTLGRVDLSDRETKDEAVIGGALTLRQARELANKIDRQRAQGLDVIEEVKAERSRKNTAAADRAANTFGSCLREFFATYETRRWKTRPRRWRDDAALLGLRYPPGADPAEDQPSEVVKGGLADVWHDKPMAGIDGHDIHGVIDAARKLGGDGRARKMHVALSAMFRWLLEQRRVTANPCVGVYKPGPPEARERVLDNAEIAAFWRGCDAIGAPFGPLFRLLLLTGCRLREAAGMVRSELKANGDWVVPGDRTKNHRELTLALPPLAREIIASVSVIAGEAGYIFTTTGKTPVSGFSIAKKALDAAIAKSAGHAVPEFRLHDLRRTCVTGLAALGVALPVVEKIVNHVSGSFAGVVGVYQKHEFAAEKAEALARWAQHIQGLVAEGSEKIIDLVHKRRRK